MEAALERNMRARTVELEAKQIRINAITPGPLPTPAGSSIAYFDELIDAARLRAPDRRIVTINDVGAMKAMLASDGGQKVSGDIAYVNGGLHMWASSRTKCNSIFG